MKKQNYQGTSFGSQKKIIFWIVCVFALFVIAGIIIIFTTLHVHEQNIVKANSAMSQMNQHYAKWSVLYHKKVSHSAEKEHQKDLTRAQKLLMKDYAKVLNYHQADVSVRANIILSDFYKSSKDNQRALYYLNLAGMNHNFILWPWIEYQRGNLQWALGKLSQACQDYQLALSTNHHSRIVKQLQKAYRPLIQLHLALCLEQSHKNQQALKIYHKIVQDNLNQTYVEIAQNSIIRLNAQGVKEPFHKNNELK